MIRSSIESSPNQSASSRRSSNVSASYYAIKQLREEDPRKSFAVTSAYVRRDDYDNTVKELKASTDEKQFADEDVNIVSQIETTKNIMCVCFTDNCDMIAAGFPDGMIRIFNKDNLSCLFVLHDEESKANEGTVTCIQHRPISKHMPSTNSITCTYTNGCVKCWNYTQSRCIYTIREHRQILGIAYHPRVPKFVTYGDDGKVFLYDEETKTQERTFASSDNKDLCDGHTSRVFAACFVPRNQHELITGGWDNTVQFWDVRQPYAIRHLPDVHLCAEGLDISRNGREIMTSAWQKHNPLQLWDYGSGQLIQTIKPSDGHNSMMYCVRWLNNNLILAGGCEPNIIRIVDVRTNITLGHIRGLPGGVYSIDLGITRKTKRPRPNKNPELSALPVVCFVAGKRIFQMDMC